MFAPAPSEMGWGIEKMVLNRIVIKQEWVFSGRGRNVNNDGASIEKIARTII